jgi:hypothetical protein
MAPAILFTVIHFLLYVVFASLVIGLGNFPPHAALRRRYTTWPYLPTISMGIVTSARFLASLSVTLIFSVYLPMARFSGSVSFLTR